MQVKISKIKNKASLRRRHKLRNFNISDNKKNLDCRHVNKRNFINTGHKRTTCYENKIKIHCYCAIKY